MPKTNYAYEKRQRELEKKRKKENKAQQRKTTPEPGGAPPAQPTATDVSSPQAAPQSLA